MLDLGENYISKKKPPYPIGLALRKYLHHYGREVTLSLSYSDLLRYQGSMPVYDKNGKDTLWESVMFPSSEMSQINHALTTMYALLKTEGDLKVIEHLYVDRIDYCTFGNTNPFRIRIVNQFNDNFDYFYIKKADASRVYGLELEHILSPNRINFFVDKETLLEEHIAGIPGDQFIKQNLHDPQVNEIRLAKEFVKFNERCFVRLLGDMRAYNYVIDITPDFEEVHYRIRAIDFDQQSYEGRKSIYLPQFFKENYPFVNICIKHLNLETVKQYQYEERALIAKRIKSSRYRLKDLLDVMREEELSSRAKTENLALELAQLYHDESFLKCKTMGELVRCSLRILLTKQRQALNENKRRLNH